MRTFLIAAFAVAAITAQAQTAVATSNSTIKPAGPRSGTSNTNFFNIEGAGNTTNADFGVLDFSTASFGGPKNVAVSAASITLTEETAAFTAPATLQFYAASNTTASTVNDGTSTLIYQTPGDATNNYGVGTQLGTLISLGTGNFTTTGNTTTGTVDTYALALSTAAKSYLASALASGTGAIRIVIASQTSTGAATFGGIGYTSATQPNYVGPSLTLTTQAAPEPSALAALGLGAVALLRRRRTVR